jgi:hypothetical protein
MNIKTVRGLALLDAMLHNDMECHDVFYRVFSGVDIDYVNHCISTGINGEEVIEEYPEYLKSEAFLKELDIIQENMGMLFK